MRYEQIFTDCNNALDQIPVMCGSNQVGLLTAFARTLQTRISSSDYLRAKARYELIFADINPSIDQKPVMCGT
jgi:hypothetical protein